MVEQPDGKGMNIYLATTITVLWYICYPVALAIYYTVTALVYLAKLLYRPVGFLLQPLVYFGRFALVCLIAPFQLLAKFETIYIYLGVAALVGITIGVVLNYVYGSFSSVLRLDSRPQPLPVRTAKEYREAKRKQKAKAEAPLISSGPLSPNAVLPTQLSPSYLSMSDSTRKMKRSRGLLNQTIMEEMESDY